MSLRVLVADRPPLLNVERSSNGNNIYSGYLYELLPTLLRVANITLTPSFVFHNEGSGSLRANGTWSGVMGELTTGGADLALFPLTLTRQRAAAVSHAGPFMADGYGLLVAQQQVGGGYGSFLQPFEPAMWGLLLVAIIFTSLLLFVVDGVSRRVRLHAYEQTHSPERVEKQRGYDRLTDHTMANFMMAFGNGEAPRTRSLSVKVWAVAWGFFCVIILNSYTANLAANLTASKLQGSLASLADLAKNSGSFGVPADSSVSNYFKTSTDILTAQLRPRMIEYSSYQEGAKAVRDGTLAAFVCDYSDAVALTQAPPCDLTVAPQTIGSWQLVLGLPKASKLAPKLDAALLELNEAGYLAELKRRWFVQASQCQKSDSDNSNNKSRLTLQDVWTVFLIPAAGIVLTSLVLLGEVIYYRKWQKGVYRFKSEVKQHGLVHVASRTFTHSASKTSRQLSDSLAGDSPSSGSAADHRGFKDMDIEKAVHFADAGAGEVKR